MEFREALNYGATGASEYNDVVGAGMFLKNRDDVDGSKIALWGGSYGGYLTAMGLAKAPELFAAGVDIHGVHDWNNVVKNFIPSYDANKRADWAKIAYESSPMPYVSTWKAPVLMIHVRHRRRFVSNFCPICPLVGIIRRNKVPDHIIPIMHPVNIHPCGK